MEENSPILSLNHRQAAASLFALALHHSQIRQTHISNSPSNSETTSPSDKPDPSIHHNSDLICPIFRFLGLDEKSWYDLKENAGSSVELRHLLKSFLKLLAEEGNATSSQSLDKEAALTKAVDASALNMQKGSPIAAESLIESSQKKDEGSEKKDESSEKKGEGSEKKGEGNEKKIGSQDDLCQIMESTALLPLEKKTATGLEMATFEQPLEEADIISFERKVAVLYTLVAACVADTTKDDKEGCKLRQGYDARHRVALRLLAIWLGVKWNEMEAMEAMVAYTIMDSVTKEGSKKDETVEAESSWDTWKRGGIIGAAAVTGGTLMAITGGLAAPAIAHGLGALAPTLGSIIPVIGAGGFAAAATATGSAAGSIAVAASFGAAGASLTGNKMATRIGSLEEFELKEVGGINQGLLAVRISISGLVFEEKDFIKPWEGGNDNMERYVLQYESKNLIALSTALQDWLTQKITAELMKEGAMMTVLSSLVAALAWPATLVAAFDIIDSRWAVAVDRSDKAGKVLADVLLKGLQGYRPVTLVGFSLGARVIFKCLQVLAESKGAGIVERVVILGAPIPIKDENWEAARNMVAGRFVNGYSTDDWTLGVTFRASLLSQGLAGIQPVDVPGIENVNVTQVIEGHSSYLEKTQGILDQLELDNCCAVFTSVGHENPEEKSTFN